MGSEKRGKEAKMSTTKQDLGNRIRELRKKAGFKNQKQLAKKIIIRKGQPTTTDQIGRIERGATNYGIDVLFQIAEILKIDVAELFSSTINETQTIEGRIRKILHEEIPAIYKNEIEKGG